MVASGEFTVVKAILLGDPGVGKTSILCRMHSDGLLPAYNSASYPTIGQEFTSRSYRDGTLKLQLWDTCGVGHSHGLTRSYYRGTNIGVVVHDAAIPNYEAVGRWMERLIQLRVLVEPRADDPCRRTNQFCVAVVANKIDAICRHSGPQLGTMRDYVEDRFSAQLSELGASLHFYECSAKTNEGVMELFEDLMTRNTWSTALMPGDRKGSVRLPTGDVPIHRRPNNSDAPATGMWGCQC